MCAVAGQGQHQRVPKCGCGHVLVKLKTVSEQAAGRIWPLCYSLLTPGLEQGLLKGSWGENSGGTGTGKRYTSLFTNLQQKLSVCSRMKVGNSFADL